MVHASNIVLQTMTNAADISGVDRDHLIELTRPLVAVIDGSGVFQRVHGGYGGFLGHDAQYFSGKSVFDVVHPDEIPALMDIFVENLGGSIDTIALPMPFRANLIGSDGISHPVDLIPTGQDASDEVSGWVVTLVPVALNASLSRSLDAEMAGIPRDEVKRVLTEELVIDNTIHGTRWFLVDLTIPEAPTVSTSRDDDQPMAATLAAEIAEGWAPWTQLSATECSLIDIADIPLPLRTIAATRDWRRVALAPVAVDGRLAAVYFSFARVPTDYPLLELKSNVRGRIASLVDVTRLLFSKWWTQDRLVHAATSDSLTGLANRNAFADALATTEARSALLYIDIDDFKTINDRFGHEIGDQVLRLVAERIKGACRPVDLVARFGGDEFVALLDGASATDAAAIADRIVELASSPLGIDGGPDCVHVSVGVATIDDADDALRAKHAINAADHAMLRAKRLGGSQVITADE